MENNKILKLFACCIPVKGFKRSIIYDLQRKRYFFIPNSLFEMLTNEDGKPLFEIRSLFPPDEQPLLNRYLNFLLDNEIIFLCDPDKANLFHPIDFKWNSPFILENFILDTDVNSNHDYEKIIKELSDINLRVLQLRFFNNAPFVDIEKLLTIIDLSNIRNVELVIPENRNEQINWEITVEKFRKITALTIYNSEKNSILTCDQASVIFSKSRIKNAAQCGIIDKEMFLCNMEFFNEAKNCNTCLNRKLSIDQNGEIKSCPSMQQSFGNIKETTIKDVLLNKELTRFWNVNKDSIDVCMDCEFRYMCTDCRAYINDSSNPFSKPAKCHYNPYITKWKGEENYIPAEQWKRENNNVIV